MVMGVTSELVGLRGAESEGVTVCYLARGAGYTLDTASGEVDVAVGSTDSELVVYGRGRGREFL